MFDPTIWCEMVGFEVVGEIDSDIVGSEMVGEMDIEVVGSVRLSARPSSRLLDLQTRPPCGMWHVASQRRCPARAATAVSSPTLIGACESDLIRFHPRFHVSRTGSIVVFGGYDGKRVVQSSEILAVKREAEVPATPPGGGGGGDAAGDSSSPTTGTPAPGTRKSRASISPTVSTHGGRASVDLGSAVSPSAGAGAVTGRRSAAAIRAAIQCEMDRHSAEMARLLAELASGE